MHGCNVYCKLHPALYPDMRRHYLGMMKNIKTAICGKKEPCESVMEEELKERFEVVNILPDLNTNMDRVEHLNAQGDMLL
jgi:hypothetical protein